MMWRPHICPNQRISPTMLGVVFALACISSATGFASNDKIGLPRTTTALSYNPLRIIEPEVGQSAIEYVEEHDYLVYDLFEDATRETTMMKCWAYDNGIQHVDGFKLIEENKGKEVYAATATDLPAGTPCLYVPEYLILSSNKAMAELRCDEMLESEAYVVSKGAESEARQWYLMLKILKVRDRWPFPEIPHRSLHILICIYFRMEGNTKWTGQSVVRMVEFHAKVLRECCRHDRPLFAMLAAIDEGAGQRGEGKATASVQRYN